MTNRPGLWTVAVKAINVNNDFSMSAWSAGLIVGKPEAPAGFGVVGGSGQVTVSFT